ncbi:hypothetical protein [Bradyrhizobium sp. LA6.12]|uniref:hypothetical protein n=1 Tax=unclassified Bradyrhizobium TaxID=2631580 RepID=UPI00339189F4
MSKTEHPFAPGARVAVSEKYTDNVAENFVDKVYKSGNFTLRGSKQQWSPWQSTWSDKRWSAMETGSGFHRRRLDLWDDATDQELKEKIEAQNVKKRWRDIRSKIDNIKEPTAALCDAVEAALSLPRPTLGRDEGQS